jgi:L-lactate dehydrogenase complex protein LldG
MSARDRILGRIRMALAEREHGLHPGPFEGWRPEGGGEAKSPVDRFITLFEAAGGEVMRFNDHGEASAWVQDFASRYETVSVGRLARFPTALGATDPRKWLESAEPSEAEVGISMSYGAVAETGSLIMIPADGRGTQLLPPVHVVWAEEDRIFPTLYQALSVLSKELPSAIGLHSGPSKSADIGQILVKGVHGPGRLIVVLLSDSKETA